MAKPWGGWPIELGIMILEKLELWELVIVFNNNLCTATNFAFATLRQSVTGNLTFRGIVVCNLSTPKPVISNWGNR